MNKRYIFAIVLVVVVLPAGWYLLSPLWRSIELDDASPISKDDVPRGQNILSANAFDHMDEQMKLDFEKKMEEMKDVVMEKEDVATEFPQIISDGQFVPRAHEVEGQALLIQEGDERILRFENFETVNGPNLHIYLSTGPHSDDFVDLGPIRATKGNVNYEIAADIDLKKYNHVLVWCVPFRVLFSYAELSPA